MCYVESTKLTGIQYIKTTLKDELGLSSKGRAKPTADTQDLDALIHHLWAEDKHTYRQEFDRVKLAFYLLLLAYTAARPGAVIVSDAYRNSNQALSYRVSPRTNFRHLNNTDISKGLKISTQPSRGWRPPTQESDHHLQSQEK